MVIVRANVLIAMLAAVVAAVGPTLAYRTAVGTAAAQEDHKGRDPGAKSEQLAWGKALNGLRLGLYQTDQCPPPWIGFKATKPMLT